MTGQRRFWILVLVAVSALALAGVIVITDPTRAQLAYTLVLTLATLVLAGATFRYVQLTQELAVEAKRTNDMAQRDMERRLRASAPALAVVENDRAYHDEDDTWSFGYQLANRGSSVAHGAEIHTPNGSTQPLTIPTDGRWYSIKLLVPTSEFKPGERPSHPPVDRLTFTDPGGTRWEQELQELPRIAGDG